MKIEDFLRRHAEERGDKTAVVCGSERRSYSQLYDEAMTKATKYEKGTAVPFPFPSSIDALTSYFAIHMAGAVAVPLAKDLPEAVLSDYSARISQLPALPDGTADILFTTGTTGEAKGVVISNRTIIANAENLIDRQGFTPNLSFIVNGPLNHIGSLSKLYPMIYLGGTIHLIDGMKSTNDFFNAIDEAEGKVATFLVPANIRILLRFAADQLKSHAHKIDFIETGAAPMAQADIEALAAMLPGCRLYNTYASTETGIIASFDYNEGECIEGCLGRPMKHSSVTIGDGGQIICGGPTLMTGYVNWQAKESAEVINTGTIANNLLFTSDIGEIDDKGRLHLKGRTDDIINVGGFKVAPTEVESAALTIDGITDCICIQGENALLGNCLKLLYVANEEISKRLIATHLKTMLETHKIPLLYERVEKIRRNTNGKLDRKSYR